MKMLVAGGAGFVGSHLCGRLLDDGHAVYCLDNLTTGRRSNVSGYLDHPRFSFVERSVLEPIWIPTDVIFNLASPASPPHYQADPEGTLLTNIEGTLNLLRLAEANGSHFIYASSSEVYGDPAEHPQQESYLGNVNTMGPRACYDEGKRCGETLCYMFANRDVPVSVVRIFNTYGPRMRKDDGRAVSNLITQALDGEPLTVYGDGSHTRSFCYVDDLVEGLVRLAGLPQPPKEPLNLGNPAEVTVLHLARTVLKLTGSRSRIVHRPLPVDDPTRRCPDITRAREVLDWAPRTKLEDGLRATMQYFRNTMPMRESVPAAAS